MDNQSMLASIIIVNWNTADMTIECLKRVRKHTRQAFEIILVDNGSVDDSVERISALKWDNLKLISLPENLGYAKGNNRGINESSGDILVLLNSDAFVTRNWSTKMMRCLKKYNADMVGPCTNNAKGDQRYGMRVKGLIPQPFRKTQAVKFLSFFCVLLKREVVDTVGLLDDGYGLGMFEDDDFCKRAVDAGYKLMIDGKTWVWHEGNQSFIKNKIDIKKLYESNKNKYADKWKN